MAEEGNNNANPKGMIGEIAEKIANTDLNNDAGAEQFGRMFMNIFRNVQNMVETGQDSNAFVANLLGTDGATEARQKQTINEYFQEKAREGMAIPDILVAIRDRYGLVSGAEISLSAKFIIP